MKNLILKNKPVHEEEISNDPTDKVDFTGKDKSTIKTDFIQDSGKIQVNTMDLNPMEGNLLDKASVTDDTVKVIYLNLKKIRAIGFKNQYNTRQIIQK